MNILAIESSTQELSVSLKSSKFLGEKIKTKSASEELRHLTKLVPLIKELLSENDLSVHDIPLIAISEGPGSFTGLRIGFSAARAIAQVTGAKLLPVDSIKAFAFGEQGIVAPFFDARTNEVYGAVYEIAPSKKILTRLPTNLFSEEEFKTLALKFSPRFINLDDEKAQTSEDVLRLAEYELAHGAKPVPFSAAVPAYHKKSAAERKLEAKNAK
jgi:tRNA threonylcarbamoyl adenosine modification protein YeaZ